MDTLHCTTNGISSRHCYSFLDVHDRDTSGVALLGRWLDGICFQQGGIGPVGNPGPQGVKGYQVSVTAKSLLFKMSSLLICSLCVWCTAGGERRLGRSRSPRSNRDPWGVWRTGKVDSTCLCVRDVKGVSEQLYLGFTYKTIRKLVLLKWTVLT